MNKVKQLIRFDNLFVVDPTGTTRGLAIFWSEDITIKKTLFTSFSIELLIDDPESKMEWWCMYVCASSNN